MDDGNAVQEGISERVHGGAPASAAIVQQAAATIDATVGAGAEATPPPLARRALLASLATVLGAAVEVGDVEAARAVHETIGRLLGASG